MNKRSCHSNKVTRYPSYQSIFTLIEKIKIYESEKKTFSPIRKNNGNFGNVSEKCEYSLKNQRFFVTKSAVTDFEKR